MTPPRHDQDSVDRHVARWAGQLEGMDPEVEGAITRMQAITKRIRADDHAAYAGSDDTIEDYWTLHALLVQPYPEEATPAQLADACGVTRATMTARVDRLVQRGHVTREVDPVDRRRIIVRPTRSGRSLWQKGIAAGMAREQAAFSALSAKELVSLNALLRKVVLHLEEG
ncbi:MAG: MarR family transcriptional regulator [Terrabacter sp.]|nr:MarR family transcriptional regulator [Terrabacter sp.]